MGWINLCLLIILIIIGVILYQTESNIPWIAAIIVIVILSATWINAERTTRYEQGEEEGYNTGYERGYERGREDGHSDGRVDGYDEGYRKGHEEGYDEGRLSPKYEFSYDFDVVVNLNDKKYHHYGCKQINWKSFDIYFIEDVKELGYTPCSICFK